MTEILNNIDPDLVEQALNAVVNIEKEFAILLATIIFAVISVLFLNVFNSND